jgi:hypothetical protein
MTKEQYDNLPAGVWDKYNRAAKLLHPAMDIKDMVSKPGSEATLLILNDHNRLHIKVTYKGLFVGELCAIDIDAELLFKKIGRLFSTIYRRHLEITHSI